MTSVMKSFFQLLALRDLEPWFTNLSQLIQQAENIRILVPSTIEGMLATIQLESSFLDSKQIFSRRFTPSKNHLPKDQQTMNVNQFQGLTLLLDVESEHIPVSDIEMNEQSIRIQPIEVNLEFKQSDRQHTGSLDVVFISSILASLLAPNGKISRAMRQYSGLGLWCRGVMDQTIDPMYTMIRNHLQEEGTIRVVPLPEVPKPVIDMIPEISPRMLLRLTGRWSAMDFDQRCQSLSELALVGVSNQNISTARYEELIWNRVLSGDEELDFASCIHLLKAAWPNEEKSAALFASKTTDEMLTTQKLPIV